MFIAEIHTLCFDINASVEHEIHILHLRDMLCLDAVLAAKQKVHAHVIGVPNIFVLIRGSLFRDRRYLASSHAIVTTKLESGLSIFIYEWKRFLHKK